MSGAKHALKRGLSLGLAASGVAWVRAARARDSLRILTYHRVNDDPDDFLAVSPDAFARHMAHLRDHWAVLPLREAVPRLAGGSPLPRRAVCVTFDDGYADNHSHALPVLRRLGLPATVFLVHDYLGTDRIYPWYEPAGPPGGAPQVMDWEQARELQQAGVDLGVHTLTHPILTELPPERARREISEAKRLLEARLGPMPFFAYPRGLRSDFSASIAAMVREAGFKGACTTVSGVNPPGCDPFTLRRSAVEREDESELMFRLLLLGTSDLLLGALRDHPAGVRLRRALGRGPR